MQFLIALVILALTEALVLWIRRTMAPLHDSQGLWESLGQPSNELHTAHVSDRTLVEWAVRLTGWFCIFAFIAHS